MLLMIYFLRIFLFDGTLTPCWSPGLVPLWWFPVLSIFIAPQFFSGRRFFRLRFLMHRCNLSLVGSPGIFASTSAMSPNSLTSFRINACTLHLSTLLSPLSLLTISALLPLWVLFFGPLTLPWLVFRCWLLNGWIGFGFSLSIGTSQWQLICNPVAAHFCHLP